MLGQVHPSGSGDRESRDKKMCLPPSKQGLREQEMTLWIEKLKLAEGNFTTARWEILGTCVTKEPLHLTSCLRDRALTTTILVLEWEGMHFWDLARKRRPCFLRKRNILRPRVGTTGRLPGRVTWALLQGY